MSRLPIRIRLALAFALVMAVVFSAVGASLYVRLGDTLDERIAEALEERTAVLTRTLDASAPAAAGDEGVAQVIASDGSVASASGISVQGSLLTLAQLEQASLGAVTFDTDELRVHATPAGDRVLVVGEALEDRDEALDGLLAQLVVILPLALLVSSVIGYLVAGAALRPVEAMRRRAAEISADTPERRLPLPRADDEISRLGETLNEMLERLDAGLARERRFVADASHELRTPLASLQTELELAARRPRSPAELETALHSAGEEVERLVSLAEDLLVFARSDEGSLAARAEPINVRELLGEVARRQNAHATSAARTIDVSAPDHLVLVGDRRRLEQALENLVDNALRHGAGTVRMNASAANGVVVLAVSDDGTGFAPDFLPHAFERFSRPDAARSGGGAGLGMAIADAIARAHEGTAHAANATGCGAHVWLELPSRLNADDVAPPDRDDVD